MGGEDYCGLVVVARMGSMDQVSTGGFPSAALASR